MKLAFYKGISFTSKLIRFQSRGPYSHVGILFSDGSIIEAWQDGGVLHNANIGTKHSKGTEVDIFYLPEVTIEQQRRGHAFLIKQLVAKYDYRGVFQFLMLPRVFTGDVEERKTHWFCSDLAYVYTQVMGLDLFLRAPRGRLNPTVFNYSPLMKYSRTEITR